MMLDFSLAQIIEKHEQMVVIPHWKFDFLLLKQGLDFINDGIKDIFMQESPFFITKWQQNDHK
jgi:hypothetical protein